MDAASTYEALADANERRSEPRQRDIFLALAADAHASAGRPAEAERIRQKLLRHSPYHLLKPYTSFTEALRSSDVNDYLGDLRQQFPPDTALQMLTEMGGPLFAQTVSFRGSAEKPPPQAAPQAQRRAAPSPYAASAPTSFPPKPEGPTLTWVPGLLVVLVLLLSLAWALYVFGGPFLE